MTTFLYSIQQTDPHGWVLTLISVSVVFCALLILYGVYSLSGAIFAHGGEVKSKAEKRVRRRHKANKEASAATGSGADGEVGAAIATALHLYLSDQAHDIEPGIITIRRPGAWASASNFRKNVK